MRGHISLALISVVNYVNIVSIWQAVLPCSDQRQATSAVGSKEPYIAQRDAI